ncbi:ATP-binding protein [Pseudaestuariivita sp.]|uniref:ATP-binding protein n=1 Tax=Pseudaestuariivita sp. TaxID=2211669 RepID=UPI00405996A2
MTADSFDTGYVDSGHFESGLCVRLKNDTFSVRHALSDIIAALKSRKVDPEALGSVEIVLAEALNNVVEHAYDATECGDIEVNAQVLLGRVQFDILDTGRQMPFGTPPLGHPVDLDTSADDLPEGGFGWFLIREMTETLEYTHQNGRNRLSLTLAT